MSFLLILFFDFFFSSLPPDWPPACQINFRVSSDCTVCRKRSSPTTWAGRCEKWLWLGGGRGYGRDTSTRVPLKWQTVSSQGCCGTRVVFLESKKKKKKALGP